MLSMLSLVYSEYYLATMQSNKKQDNGKNKPKFLCNSEIETENKKNYKEMLNNMVKTINLVIDGKDIVKR